jgi:hypothetical protein
MEKVDKNEQDWRIKEWRSGGLCGELSYLKKLN